MNATTKEILAQAEALTTYTDRLASGDLKLSDLLECPHDLDVVGTLLQIKAVRINMMVQQIAEIKKTQLTDEDNRA